MRLIPEDAEPAAFAYSRCGRTDRGVSALGQVGDDSTLLIAFPGVAVSVYAAAGCDLVQAH